MAQIPTYGGPQVQQEALRPVYQNTPDVSSGAQAVARGLQQLGQGLDAKADREAETEANRIDTEITAKWLDWDSEARRKYQGQNVGQYEVEARDWWKKTAGDYGASANPRVRERIGTALGRKQNQALGSVLGHVNAEKDRFADQQAESAAQTSIEFGIDTGDMAGARQRVRQITAEQAARKGWTTEQVDAENQRRLGTLHLAYIDRVAQEDAEKARAYYEQNKAEIPGATQNRVEKVLKGEGDNQFATQFAAQNATLPLAEQLTKAGEIKDPERREKTLLQIRNQHGLVKAAQEEREAAASDTAWQTVGQGKRVPERVLQAMNGKERVQLQDYLKQRAEHAATKGSAPVKTDPLLLSKVYDLMRENPDEFKRMRMESLAFKLSGSDIEQVSRIQRDMLKPDGEKDVVAFQSQLAPYVAKLNNDQKAAFQDAANRWAIGFKEANKRAPTDKERQDQFDKLSLEGEVRRGAWYKNDPNKRMFETTADERAKFVPTITSDERAALVKSFQARGVANPTEQQISDAARRLKGL